MVNRHTNDPSSHEPEDVSEIQKYEDFTTIDWIQDSITERNRRIRLNNRVNSAHDDPNGKISIGWLWTQIRKIAVAGESWFVVSLVGICIGVNAALISIITEWLSDLKMGYCYDAWWLNQQFCCWEIESGDEACDSWRDWSDYTAMRWVVYVIVAGVFSFIAAHLVRSLAKYAAGSGISEIKCILGGFVMKGYLGAWTFAIKSLTLPLVIASGLSVGKEGPSVHVACCVGNLVAGLFTRFSQSQGKRREIVTAASAAGVAVAFGSPIGGVLFSIEEMSNNFSIKTLWRSFFCALVATVTLSAMNPFRTGKLVLFQVTYNRDWHFFEIIFFIILGIFGGLYGAIVINLNLRVAAFRRRHLANHGLAEAVILALLTGVAGYLNRFLRIDMTESMSILFRECDGSGDYDNLCQTSEQWTMVNSLFLATIIRTLLVIVSYGAKVPAGIFVPSMAIGAYFGRLVGIIVKAIHKQYEHSGMFAVCQPDVPCITPGTYAFLGAAAALSGIMRITVTVVVIMFELTGALTYILPTMIVVLVTKAVGDLLGTNGIADEMIKFNGYPFLEKEDHAFNVPVARVMKQDLHTLPISGTIQDVETLLNGTAANGFPIVTNDARQTLVGYIGRREVRYVIERASKMQNVRPDTLCSFAGEDPQTGDDTASPSPPIPRPAGAMVAIEDELSAGVAQSTLAHDVVKFWPWVQQTPLTVSPQLPLEIVMQLFKRMGPRVILVEDHGTLVGLLTVKDVLKFTHLHERHERRGMWWNDERIQGHEVEGILDDMWIWAGSVLDRVRGFFSRQRRRP